MSGEYAAMAAEYAAHRLVPVPVDVLAKKPCLGWRTMRNPPSADTIRKFADKWPDAGIGLLPGPSGRVVVDVDTDDNGVISEVERRFGSTPFMVETPSGGRHFYYRSSGERNRQRLDGMPVDIRGHGGLVVAPPTTKPGGRAYRIVRGTLDDLDRAPPLKPGSLPARSPSPSRSAPLTGDNGNDVGRRNDTLFGYLMRRARSCATEADLALLARSLNETFDPPLTSEEVAGRVASVWRYRIEDRLWSKGGEAHVIVDASDMDRYRDEPEALYFLCRLRQCQSARCARGETFALSIRAMAAVGVFEGWSTRKLRHCRDVVIQKGDVCRVSLGGRGEGDAAQFRFSSR